MASSMLTADVPSSSSREADVDNVLKTDLHSCINDPDFAIICDFFQKFSKDLGLDLPNFKLLLQWLTKTDEVSPQLRDMQIKLLRKTRKTVHEKSWESALSKFCFTYSAQDGWEIERFGYKNSSVKVKLRILRELLECQFEHNTKFRAKILALSADSLRSKPIGRDRQGHAYWVTQDNDCNIRIYQEHLDEEIWQVVATNRDEFVNLLERLRGSELVLPCTRISIIDDDTTSSSSQIDSYSLKKVPPPEEIDDTEEDEQKVPKLSIKLIQGRTSAEINNGENVGKGEEDLAAEEDAKLLKKTNNDLNTVESCEEEFEEIEEDYSDENDSESGSDNENELKEEQKLKQMKTEQKQQKCKSNQEDKKVKPLLISQNKVVSNNSSSEFSNTGEKRCLDQEDISSHHRNENQIDKDSKKFTPFVLDSKRIKLSNKYEDNKKRGGPVLEECPEVEEEIDEEDIDSVAAEEDENEEKLFEDYDDEEEETDEVGEEIADPIRHVVGEGSGKDCDVGSYLYCIDMDNENVLALSDVIVEDVCFFYGEGTGKQSLMGNNKPDDDTNTEKKCSKNLSTKIEEKSEPKEKKNDIETFIPSFKVSTSNNSGSTTNLDKNAEESNTICEQTNEETTKNCDDIKKLLNVKEHITQINGEKKSEISSKSENADEKELNKNKKLEKPLEDNIGSSPLNIIQQTNANKKFVLESLKKELRESKQKLLEQKLLQNSEFAKLKLPSTAIFNRKRRLTDQQQATSARPSNSESEIEPNSENNEDVSNEKDIDEIEQDVGGKRLKIRPKLANTELRKKIEAQKVAAKEETTSSSGGEEEFTNAKKLLPKQLAISTICKSEHVTDITKHDIESCGIDVKSETQQSTPLKQSVQTKPTKTKPSLAEVVEKKFKKTPEKLKSNLTAGSVASNIEEVPTEKKLYSFPNKSPITKPLKKNLLIQIRQEGSDEDTVPRKRSNSQELSSTALCDTNTLTTTTKSNENSIIAKIDVEKQKPLSERQRKRRSREETVKNDCPEEPEAKKEVTVVDEETIILKNDKPNEVIKEHVVKENPKNFEKQKESSPPFVGRRSGRRGCVVPSYVENLQAKRNRASTKTSKKCEFTGHQKIEPKEELSSKKDVANKSNMEKLSSIKSRTHVHEENDITENENKKKNLLEVAKADVSTPKPSSISKTPAKGIRKKHEVDTTNIIDIDSETPVRQSRRIAQQKIREEAERRKLEEIALRTMKQELKKKKKAEKLTDPTVIPPTEPSSESEDSDVEVKKRVQKKKCPGKNGNWSSGSEEQEEPEEEDEEHHHYETDPGSPLFKSDHEFSPESDIEDESQVVPMKRARTVRKEDADGEPAFVHEEEEACQKCNKSDHPEWILLCDNCDKGYHCSCLSPVLFYIPEGSWYCPSCHQDQLIQALENQLKEFDDLIENKRKVEEEEKRLAQEEKARQERELEINKHKTEKEKKIHGKRNTDSSTEHSKDDDGAITNSDDGTNINSKNLSTNSKTKSRARNFSDKRNHRDRWSNATRSRRNRHHKLGIDSDTDSQDSSKATSASKSNSSSSSTYSESDNEPIYKLRKRRQINVSYRLNEYDDLINSALKKEMDDAAGAGNLGRGKDISTIIEADKEEKARQKQIENSDVSNPKEEKHNKNVKETKLDSLNYELSETNKDIKNDSIKQDDSDAEPIIRKINIKASLKKKARKLTTLDISSEEDDGSDEDFKGSSIDDEEEEDTSISASNSDSSLEIYKRRGKFKKKRRKAARRASRERRRGRRFFAEESDDEDVQRPRSKKKRKDDSEYTESEGDDDISELSENIDSADLCDDTTTDESDGAWRPTKRKKGKKTGCSLAQKSPKSKSSHSKKIKKVEYSDDDVSESEDDEADDGNEEMGSGKGMGKQPRSQPLKSNSNSEKTKGKGKEKYLPKAKKKKSSEDDSSESDSEDSTRRTRGRRYAYIEDFDDDSSDGGIKPGVQRPDTPPEEREKFIKRQEEIKRMLAEKNAEGAKIVATPRLTPIKTDDEKDKKLSAKTGVDSLSTVPLSVIRQAKVLDIDYLQRRGENLEDLSTEVGEVDDDFDDADLPDDLPEDMDEDAIARMVEEEEEFVAAAKDIPAQDEVLRTSAAVKPLKNKEVEKTPLPLSTSSQFPLNTSQVHPATLSTPTSNLQEPVRKRLPMPTIYPPLLRHQFLMHDSAPNTQHLVQRHGGAHTSQLLQNALSAPLTQPLDRNYPPVTPSTAHHSLINRMAHSITMQPTSSHSLNTRPAHPSTHSIHTKSSQFDHTTQDKSVNPQNITENKPRGRRKKITPLRDTLQKQQAAAAVTAATASSLVKTNDPTSNSLLSNLTKSGSTPKSTMQNSIMSNMAPTSHSGSGRSGVSMPPLRAPYIRTDGPRFYDALGTCTQQSGSQRHRRPPQMPPSLLPPHPANRSSYGPPPPLKGSNIGPPISSSSNTPVAMRNPLHHVPPPYLGMPPNARHASHLNMYSRPPIFGNPNFGPRINLRPNIHQPDYSSGPRAYPPYGFYPPPPPLTTPGQRGGSGSVPRPSIPPVQTNITHHTPSVIVSATSSKASNTPTVITPQPPQEKTDNNSSSKSVPLPPELPIKISPPKPSPPTHVMAAEPEKLPKTTRSVGVSQKELTTLETYTTTSARKSPMLVASESSESRSPYNPPTEINDESSAPDSSENTPTTNRQEGQVSEFSGLVSYFSSQHDDYNT